MGKTYKDDKEDMKRRIEKLKIQTEQRNHELQRKRKESKERR